MDIVLVLEDCFETGSVGQQIAAGMEEAGQRHAHVILQNLKGHFAPEGTVEQLRTGLAWTPMVRRRGKGGDRP